MFMYFLLPVCGDVSLAVPFMMKQEVVLPKIGTVLQFGTAGTVMRARVDSAMYASMGGLATAAVSMRVIVLSKCISCVDTYMGHIEDMGHVKDI